MTDFTMKTDADGVAIITWDVEGKSMNVANEQAFMELDSMHRQRCCPTTPSKAP